MVPWFPRWHHPAMTNHPSVLATRAVHYAALAAKFRQRADYARLRQDVDFVNTYERLASGYDALARSAWALSSLPTSWRVSA
jgi:hypothetical protein